MLKSFFRIGTGGEVDDEIYFEFEISGGGDIRCASLGVICFRSINSGRPGQVAGILGI